MLKKLIWTALLSALFTNGLFASKDIKMLDKKQQNMITISAFSATGDMNRLEDALHCGLDAKLTISEIKEIFAHLYAYVGFPRSLNAQNLFMSVVESRKKAGKKDIEGKKASAKPKDYDAIEYGKKVRAKLAGLKKDYTGAAYQEFSPVIDEYLLGHLFGDIFSRDVLDMKQRELITISALASMSGTQGQLNFHFKASMNVGFTKAELKDFIKVIDKKVSSNQAKLSKFTLDKVLENKK
jgi:alkylhydroperoxidase/carboxymuconolactone decarboxylase family protein YurZ